MGKSTKLKNKSQWVNYKDFTVHAITGHINHFICPMGTGKTTAINKFIDKNPNKKILIFTPFTQSMEEIVDRKNTTKFYMLPFISSQWDQVCNSNKPFKEVKRQLVTLTESYDYLIMDEGDFFLTQISAMPKTEQFMYSQLYLMFMSIFSEKIELVISVSANPLVMPPPKLDGIKCAVYIHTIYLGLAQRINVASCRVLTNGYSRVKDGNRAMMTVVERLVERATSNEPVLLYNWKWSLPMIKMFDRLGVYVISRHTLLPNKPGTPMYKSDPQEPKYYIPVGSGTNLLNDTLFVDNSCIAVNTSSSRAVSLTNRYNKATVVIFADTIKATALQVIGRFRNTPVDVVWLTNKTIDVFSLDKFDSIDAKLITSFTHIPNNYLRKLQLSNKPGAKKTIKP